MVGLIVCLVGMILVMVLFDGVAAYVLGDTNKGNRIFSSLITIGVLYLIFTSLIGSGIQFEFISNGIPFALLLDKETTLVSIMMNSPLVFVKEAAELISLFFIISYIEKLLPANNSHTSLMITSRIILVLIGIITNCFFVSLASKNEVYQWALTILQCLISGATITITPAIYIGKLLGINPDNPVLRYVINQLPGTALGKAFTDAVSRSSVLIIGVMIFESTEGPLWGAVELSIDLVYYIIGPIVTMIIGMSIVIKSLFKK